MKPNCSPLRWTALAATFACTLSVLAQSPDRAPQRDDGPPPNERGLGPPDGGANFGGPPPFGPGGFGAGNFGGGGFMPGGPGAGGFGGMMQSEVELVKKFDRNGDQWLNNEERKAARESLSQRGGNRRMGGPGGRRGGFGPPGESEAVAQPGPRISPADVKSFADAPLYASNVLRTLFLEFENADWERELEDFHNTDVEVPAKLTVDGKAYPDVGVHFRGASSYMMVGSGRKRSLNLSLDFVHDNQNVGGYRTLNLLNSHGDPTFLRAVLYYDIARNYVPAPKANLVRLVINGESWGIYVSLQQFNKDFVQEWFNTRKGARWKVPGSPNGRGNLAYLGEDAAAYRRIYEIKSKDDPKSWADLIKLCQVLNETPADRLEAALAPLLDIDGALKFLALENVMINNDGYWVRTSDYDIYQNEKGRFHIIPYDANETFSAAGGPGFGGGPDFGGGPGFGGGRDGMGGFGPAMSVAPPMFAQADKNSDQKVTRDEFSALGEAWFDKLDPEKAGQVNQGQFADKLPQILPPPQGQPGFSPRGADQQRGGRAFGGGRGGFGPPMLMVPGLFAAMDANKDGSLTRAELKGTFAKWCGQWDAEQRGSLNEEQFRRGLEAVLPRPNFGGPGGGFAGRGGQRGPGGGGFGGMRGSGVELDPLVAANDQNKPLISKLLAVPSLRTRYLGYVRDIAEQWLDWKRLGPLVQQYATLIGDEVKADTRKLSTFEAFQRGVGGESQAQTARGPERGGSLKSFADQRRAYLLSYQENKKSAQ